MTISQIPQFRLAALASVALLTPAFAAVSIDYVLVDDTGNNPDGSGYGAVGYKYHIARNETSLSQYAEFLNAVAATDTHNLYEPSMAMASNGNIAGISRSGSSGSYTYAVIGSGDRPVTYVSWFDAARFANWLHHGQPTGALAAGSTEDGAYTLLGAVSGTGFIKNPGAKVWIPSENEWYKAAYYDPNKGGAGVGGYWLHANQSDSMTTNTVGVDGAANFFDGDYVGSGTSTPPIGNALTNVGLYGPGSQSSYGTNDQGGNVWEWNDAVIVSGVSRGLRGGSWGDGSGSLSSATRVDNPVFFPVGVENAYIGFRVAAVPEPSALLLTVLFSGGLLARRRR